MARTLAHKTMQAPVSPQLARVVQVKVCTCVSTDSKLGICSSRGTKIRVVGEKRVHTSLDFFFVEDKKMVHQNAKPIKSRVVAVNALMLIHQFVTVASIERLINHVKISEMVGKAAIKRFSITK